MSLHPGTRYFLVDIPPALYVAEQYLSRVFPNRRIFPFRPFQRYEEVGDELGQAEIAFLLPSQLELLPDKSIDLFVNISSLHEMRPDQIEFYFQQIDRLTRRFFYFKQWRTTVVPLENVTLGEGDYPVRKHWKQLFWRPCPVQSAFFEAQFEIP